MCNIILKDTIFTLAFNLYNYKNYVSFLGVHAQRLYIIKTYDNVRRHKRLLFFLYRMYSDTN